MATLLNGLKKNRDDKVVPPKIDLKNWCYLKNIIFGYKIIFKKKITEYMQMYIQNTKNIHIDICVTRKKVLNKCNQP